MLGIMQINSGQITPGPSLFQALHSGPKAPDAAQGGKPVAETQEETAVQASRASDKPAVGEDDGRDRPRGGLVDVKI